MFSPATGSLIDLHWFPVKAIVKFTMCLLTFKVVRFGEPKYLADRLSFAGVDVVRTLRSADDEYRFVEPRAVNERGFAARSFSYVAPRLFNELPVWLKSLNSLDCFKKHLKSFLFTKAYDLTYRVVNDDYKV